MDYQIAKVFNNNTVLAQDKSKNQVILMSKGIGFGKHIGEIIKNDDSLNQKIFYILDENVNTGKMKEIDVEVKKMEQVTQEIVFLARERLHINNDKLYDALVDHITFAIECLRMGLPIDNPFSGEIAILYSQEYEIAQVAAEIIKERIGVEIGDEEAGFIALHLYSARKNKHIRSTMKSTRVYSEILSLVGSMVNSKIDSSSLQTKSFLLSLRRILQISSKQKTIQMPIKQQIKLSLPLYYKTAQSVAELIKTELGIVLGEDEIAFITLDIFKLTQM